MRARVRWPQANLFAVLVFSVLRFGDFALAQPVAFAVHLEDMDVVGQAIENGACEAFRRAVLAAAAERLPEGGCGRASSGRSRFDPLILSANSFPAPAAVRASRSSARRRRGGREEP